MSGEGVGLPRARHDLHGGAAGRRAAVSGAGGWEPRAEPFAGGAAERCRARG